jgi:predicted patatin/cPLA2 family phospholipase
MRRQLLPVLVSFGLIAGLCGCATIMERAVPPASAANFAVVPGLAHVRFWGDEVPKDIVSALKQRMPSLGSPPRAQTTENGRPVVHYLALSGGGSDGAFGAGLLAGWSKAGTRPKFEFVTGISAGALIAPFAFLGPAYDRQLEEIWTQYGDDELVTKQPLGVLFGASAAVDTQLLAELIAKYVDRKFLAAIAAQYRGGRVLLIGTTNIDAKRPVVWNMGEIALSSNPKALQLFRDVLLASASIPGIMPPVKISVDAGGQTFEELHVDGGVTRQVFLTPVALKLTDFDGFYPRPPLRKVYVIRNGTLSPRYQPVAGNAAALAATSISALLDYQASGDIYRIFVASTRDGAEFRLAADQSELALGTGDLFDKGRMRQLFNAARDQSSRGYPWLRTVPDIQPGGR